MAGRNRNAGEMLMDMKLADLIGDAARAIAEAQSALDASSIKLALALAETRVSTTDRDGIVRERSLIELGFMPSFYHFTSAVFKFELSITTRLEQEFNVGLNVGLGNDQSAMARASDRAGYVPDDQDLAPSNTTTTPGPPTATTTTAPAGTTTTNASNGDENDQDEEMLPEGDDASSGSGATPGAMATQPTERSVMFGACFNIDYHHKYGYDSTASTTVTVNMATVPAPAAFRDFVSAAAAGAGSTTVGST